MSSVPMTGYKPELNYDTINSGHVDYYWGMGNTAEAVANEFNISGLIKTNLLTTHI